VATVLVLVLVVVVVGVVVVNGIFRSCNVSWLWC
jgi:hypothetical protein